MRVKSSLLIVVVLLVGAMVSGCSPGSSSPLTTMDGEPYPLDAVLTDAAAAEMLFTAEQALLHDCMAEAGFQYKVAEYVPDPGFPRYGLDDLKIAMEQGYAWFDTLGLMPPDPNAGFATSRGWEEAFFGTPEARYRIPAGGAVATRPGDGCLWEADLVLYGDDPAAHFALVSEVNQLRTAADDRFWADPGAIAAVAEWSRCMSARGFEVDALGDATHYATDADPAATEVAVADVRCKQQVHLVGRLTSIESAIQATLVAQNEELLQDSLKDRAAAVARAQSYLDGG